MSSIPPPPPREHLCNRYCSNKHTRTGGAAPLPWAWLAPLPASFAAASNDAWLCSLFETFCFKTFFALKRFKQGTQPASLLAAANDAGSGSAGHAHGNGTQASFHNPHDVAVDGDGNIIVTDQGNHRIRKMSPDGSVSRLAFLIPGVAVDGTATSSSQTTAPTASEISAPRAT